MSKINIDSTQAIMDATQLQDGKWQFIYNGEVVAEATAPAKTTASVIEEWCSAVRSRVSARTEIDEAEIIARKKRRRENGDLAASGDTTVPDPEPSSGGSDNVPVTGDVGLSGVSFEEDPEAFALEQWRRYSEAATRFEEQLQDALIKARKWEAIAKAAQGDE